ncbi:MAG: pilus assembly protein PilX [Lachnospiraceae bacterium]|nr:pilus assembly protein PilX [Lachnospiraceae bacterium]
MRKWNAIISMVILLLFLVHMIAGIFQLTGIIAGGSRVLSIMAWVMTALIGVHTVIGCILTYSTLRSMKRAGVSYFRENQIFWARRISGFAILFFILSHILLFMGKNGAVYRPNLFTGPALAGQILLVLSVAVHVISNVRPLLISLGMPSLKKFAPDILVVLSILLFLSGIAFVIYYLRWISF